MMFSWTTCWISGMIFLVGMPPSIDYRQQLSDSLKQACLTIQDDLNSAEFSGPFKRRGESLASDMGSLATEFRADRIYDQAETFIRKAIPALTLLRVSSPERAKASREEVSEAAKKARVYIDKVFKDFLRRDKERVPAAISALTESLLNQARVYPSTGNALKVQNAISGQFYLQAGYARLELAETLQKITGEFRSFPKLKPDLGKKIQTFENEVLVAYDQGQLAIDKHNEFIQLNAAIKECRELHRDGQQRAVLFQLCKGKSLLAEIQYAVEPPPTLAASKARMSRFTARLAGAKSDHSVGEFFLQRAQSLAETEEPSPSKVAAQLDAFDFYFQHIQGDAP